MASLHCEPFAVHCVEVSASSGPQVDPVEVRVCRLPDGSATAVYRSWPEGTTGPEGACRRCDACFAYGDACLMIVPGFITRDAARDYSPSRAGHRLRPT